MLSVLVEGTLTAAPTTHTSSKGQPYTTVQMRTNCDDGETIWCLVIAFQTAAAEALSTFDTGDTVAVAGPASIS